MPETPAIVHAAADELLKLAIDLLTPGSINASVIEDGRDLLARLGYDVRQTATSNSISSAERK